MTEQNVSPSDQATNIDLNLRESFPPPTYEVWRDVAEKSLKGAPFDKKVLTQTYEGITLQPMYRKADAADLTHPRTLPGFEPYVRNTNVAGLTLQSWDICQELPYSTPEQFNDAARYDLDRGQTALNLVLDRATLLGLDPDEAEVGQVGQGGLSIATVNDLSKTLSAIDLEQTPVFIQANSAALPMAGLFLGLVRQRSVDTQRLRGGIEMDPLAVLVQEGTFPRSLSGAYDRMAQLVSWVKENAPHFTAITVHGQPYHNGGAHAVQELGFVLATGVEYLREMTARKLSVDEVAPHMRFSFSIGSNYFMEIAKLRAARLLWAKIVEAFGGSPEAQKMTIHGRTSSWNKTLYDPYVNMLRTTTEAFAAVIGCCDSLHVGFFDEPVRPPDEFSRRVARNTQLILQQESHLTRVIDPGGGSWYIEYLTDAVGREAWTLFQEVEAKGGMYKVLQKGFPQAQVAETAAARAKSMARRKDVVVGTNMYANIDEKPLPGDTTDYAELRAKRAGYIEEYRTSFNDIDGTGVLNKLSNMLDATDSTVVETTIDAALAGATLGELARTLRRGDEENIILAPITPYRGSELFEALRQNAEAFAARTGAHPQVFLANMGPIPQHKARADFSTGFFQVGGFEVVTNNGFDTPEAAAQAALDSGAPVVVICSTDATYPEYVPPIMEKIKAAKPDTVVMLAGYPTDQIDAHKAAGVDDFIHIRADVYQIMKDLQDKLNIA